MRRRPYQTFRRALISVCLSTLLAGNGLAAEPAPSVRTSPFSFFGSSARSGGAQPILWIGDSLSVGKFGDYLQSYLLRFRPASKLCIYASCGSSPENWLPDTKVFVSPCGFRFLSGDRRLLTKYQNGRKPTPTGTPKLNQIYARFKPRIVIVQQGTNWMDSLLKDPDPGGVEHKAIIRKFVQQLRAAGDVQLVWILPYDASKYPAWVKDSVDRWIKECAKEMGFQTINSRSMTSRYVVGKSGNDGVHLSEEASREWALAVIKNLQRLVPSLR